jgi:hypothetical protein
MGSQFAHDLAHDPTMALETAISVHLRANCYPPVPEEMIPVCIEAIQLYNEELYNNEVELPAGVSYRNCTTAPAWAIVDGNHLHAWITGSEY